MLALLALAATVLNSSSKTATTLALQNSQQQKLGGHTLTRPTGPTQMWVDRPQNTTLRNDAKCCDSVDEIDRYLRKTYATEAATHPGVRLVAEYAAA